MTTMAAYPSSAVERAATAARLAAITARAGAELPAETTELVPRVRGLTPADERAAVEARVAALEARCQAERGGSGPC